MKVEVYDVLMCCQVSCCDILCGMVSVVVFMGVLSVFGGLLFIEVFVVDDVCSQIFKIFGVGKGLLMDVDWQKVGEFCFGLIKVNIKKGEFVGVEFIFMGFNNQNFYNFLFCGFFKFWEVYIGVKINWIDLVQVDYNVCFQQLIVIGMVDFDIMEMGVFFEGDMVGCGLLDEMLDWVDKQIEFDDFVVYLKLLVGIWVGKKYCVIIDGDCYIFVYCKDYFGKDLVIGMEKLLKIWQEVNVVIKVVMGKKDLLIGQLVYGYFDLLKGWGGFGFYFLENCVMVYVKYFGDLVWFFDLENMKLFVNNLGWVQVIQDVMDLIVVKVYLVDQINVDLGMMVFLQFFVGIGFMLIWWGDVGFSVCIFDILVVGDVVGFGINFGSSKVYNCKIGKWEEKYNEVLNMVYFGWGIYVIKCVSVDEKKCKVVWLVVVYFGGKDILLWILVYLFGFQFYCQLNFNYDEWQKVGYDCVYVENYFGFNVDSYNYKNVVIELCIFGIFQYYFVVEDELVKGYVGKYKIVQEIVDVIVVVWEKIIDQIGCESQLKFYCVSFGMF